MIVVTPERDDSLEYTGPLLDFFDSENVRVYDETIKLFWNILCDMMLIGFSICPSTEIDEIKKHFAIILKISFENPDDHTVFSIMFPFLITTYLQSGKEINNDNLLIFYGIFDDHLSGGQISLKEYSGVGTTSYNMAMRGHSGSSKTNLCYRFTEEDGLDKSWKLYETKCTEGKVSPQFTEEEYKNNMKIFNNEEYGWLRAKMGIFVQYHQFEELAELCVDEIFDLFKADATSDSSVLNEYFTRFPTFNYLLKRNPLPSDGLKQLCETEGTNTKRLHEEIFLRRTIKYAEVVEALKIVTQGTLEAYNTQLETLGYHQQGETSVGREIPIFYLRIITEGGRDVFTREEFIQKCRILDTTINHHIREKVEAFKSAEQAAETAERELLKELKQEEGQKEAAKEKKKKKKLLEEGKKIDVELKKAIREWMESQIKFEGHQDIGLMDFHSLNKGGMGEQEETGGAMPPSIDGVVSGLEEDASRLMEIEMREEEEKRNVEEILPGSLERVIGELSRMEEGIQETEIVEKLFEFAIHPEVVGRKGEAYQRDVELKTKNYFLRPDALPVESVRLPPPEGYMFKKNIILFYD